MVSRFACLIISSSIVACSSAPAPDPQPKDTTPAYYALAAGKPAPGPSRPAPQPIDADLGDVSTGPPVGAPSGQVREVTVANVFEMLEAGSAVAVDANNETTRRELGVLPGAIKLSSFSSFDESELPADKSTTLVFYCTNPDCQSAPNAAETAVKAGYTDVRVMRAGVTGWVTSGHRVDK